MLQVKHVDSLYCRYPGQIVPQPCFVKLDCDKGILTAGYNPEIGNCRSFLEFHNRTLKWSIPTLKANAINQLLDMLVPEAEKVYKNYTLNWDGSNHVGCFNEVAKESIAEIEFLCESFYGDSSLIVNYCRAEDYYHCFDKYELCFSLGINGQTTDDELEYLSDKETLEAKYEGIDIVENMLQFLSNLRDWSQNNQLSIDFNSF